MTETLLQFGGASAKDANAQQPSAQRCPVCHQNFSSDARFCPFDGEPLVEAANYDPTSDPLIGVVVDQRYDVERVLGEGGMGTVYRVRHVALGKGFALKALRSDLAADADIAERFIGEARTAAAVSHPGLVEITDFGRLADGRPYFVMELLEGEPLSWFIRRGGAMHAARALAILRQAAEAVGAAHRAGIVHRDLKPDNVHIIPNKDGSERVKVLDFGLAKVMGGQRRTRQGVVFGTPHYMSPEQAAGENVDHRADIYSLGIVMYEMLTGHVPFEADSFMGVLSKHVYMQPVPPSQLTHGAREVGVLEAVVMRCLEKKPQKRYQSFDELLDDVDRVLLSAVELAPTTSRPRSSAPLRSSPTPRPPGVTTPSLHTGQLPMTPVRPLVVGLSLALLIAIGFFAVRAMQAPSSANKAQPPASAERAPAPLTEARTPSETTEVAPAAPVATEQPVDAKTAARSRGRTSSRPTTQTPGASTKAGATAAATAGRPPPAPRRASGIRGEIVDPWDQ